MRSSRWVLFQFGSIGDFLVWLTVLEQIHVAEPNTEIIVCATRNVALLQDIASAYSYISVRPLTLGSTMSMFASPRRTTVVIPASLGRVPRRLFLLARALAFPLGSIIRFDRAALVPRVRHSETVLPFALDTLYYKNIARVHPAATALPEQITYRFAPSSDALSKQGVEPQKYILIHPFASNPKRSFPHSRWKQIIANISASYPTYPILFHIGPDEEGGAREIAGNLGVRYVGTELSFAEQATLIAEAKLYIGVDTGITHLACLLHRPSIVVGNLSNPLWLPTYNPNARILTNAAHCACKGDKTGDCLVTTDEGKFLRCLFTISDSDFYGAVREVLDAPAET